MQVKEVEIEKVKNLFSIVKLKMVFFGEIEEERRVSVFQDFDIILKVSHRSS